MSEERAGGKSKYQRPHTLNKPYDRKKSFIKRIGELLLPSWWGLVAGPSQDNDRTEANQVRYPEQDHFEQQIPTDYPTAPPSSAGLHPPAPFTLLESTETPRSTLNQIAPGHRARQHRQRLGLFDNSNVDLSLPSSSQHVPLHARSQYDHIPYAPAVPPTSTTATTAQGLSPNTGPTGTDAHADSRPDVTRTVSDVYSDRHASSDRGPLNNSSSESREPKANTSVNLSSERATLSTKPSFNPSLFGPSPPDESAVATELHSSPFYPGRTSYEGASNNRLRYCAPLPKPQIVPQKRKIEAQSMDCQTAPDQMMSSTARRIMDTLQKMPTPLSDAKKIPLHSNSMADSFLSFTPTSAQRKRHSMSSTFPRTRQTPPPRPPMTSLNITNAASLSVNRQSPYRVPPGSSTHPVSSSSQQQPALGQQSTSKSSPITTPAAPADRTQSKTNSPPPQQDDNAPRSSSGKMRRERTQLHTTRATAPDDAPVEVPSLRTDFTLPITKIPSLSFNLPMTTAPQKPTRHKMLYTFSDPLPAKQQILKKSKTTFSEPTRPFNLQKTSTTVVALSSTTTINPFPIASLSAGANFLVTTTKLSAKPISSTAKETTADTRQFSGSIGAAPVLKSGSVMDILGKGPAAAASPILKTGSVMDVLGKTSSAATPLLKTGTDTAGNMRDATAPVLKTGSSKDGSGKTAVSAPTVAFGDVVTVISQASPPRVTPQAAASLGQRAGGSAVVSPPSSANSSPNTIAHLSGPRAPSAGTNPLARFTAKSASSWECSVCMVNNDPQRDQCAACGGPKPRPVSTESSDSSRSIGTNALARFAAKSASSWECSVCMVNNDPQRDQCVACGGPKPRLVSTDRSNFNPPGGTNLLAQFAAKSASSWECSVCMVNNDSQRDQCVACGGPKPRPVSTDEGTSHSQSCTSSSSSSSTESLTISSSSSSSTGGFCLNNNAPTANFLPAGGGFSLPAVTFKSSASTGGFKFANSDGSQSPLTGGLTFGSGPTATVASSSAAGGSSFGTAPAVSTGFSFKPFVMSSTVGVATSTSTASTASFTFGANHETRTSTTDTFTIKSPVTSSIANSTSLFNNASTNQLALSSGNLSTSALTTTVKSNSTASFGGFSFASSQPPTSLFASSISTSTTSSLTVPCAVTTMAAPSMSSASGFSFGSTSATSQPSTGFIFGSTNTAPSSSSAVAFQPVSLLTNSQSNALFTPTFGASFGSNTVASNGPSEKAPIFGQFAPMSANQAGKRSHTATDVVPTKKLSISFGAPISSGTTPVFGSTPTQSQSSFGQQATPAFSAFGSSLFSSNSPNFFAGAGNTTSQTNPFTTQSTSPLFSASSTQLQSESGMESSSPGFNVGASAPRNGEVFQFQATPSAPNPAPVFAAQTNQPAAPGFNFSLTQPSFNFGATPANNTPAAPFTFGAQPTPGSSNPFNAAPTQPSSSQRVIRKARRNLRK